MDFKLDLELDDRDGGFEVHRDEEDIYINFGAGISLTMDLEETQSLIDALVKIT